LAKLAVDIFTFAVLSLFLVKLASRSAIWYKSLMVISSSHSGSWNKDSKSHRLLPPPFLRFSPGLIGSAQFVVFFLGTSSGTLTLILFFLSF
jgi:uncharacterized membrane protein